jgi:hypothetical protein
LVTRKYLNILKTRNVAILLPCFNEAAMITDVVRDFVGRGFGVGVGIFIPGLKPPKGVKPIAMKGFPPLVIGAMYQGRPKGMVQDFLRIAKDHVKGLA